VELPFYESSHILIPRWIKRSLKAQRNSKSIWKTNLSVELAGRDLKRDPFFQHDRNDIVCHWSQSGSVTRRQAPLHKLARTITHAMRPAGSSRGQCVHSTAHLLHDFGTAPVLFILEDERPMKLWYKTGSFVNLRSQLPGQVKLNLKRTCMYTWDPPQFCLVQEQTNGSPFKYGMHTQQISDLCASVHAYTGVALSEPCTWSRHWFALVN
jgi:hypothetical protein